MFSDARSIASGSVLEADICVIGAGAAGITLCREFIGRREKIILLEGGGTEFSKSLKALPSIFRRHVLEEQALAGGNNTGDAYYPLRFTRVRTFGGSSLAWQGHGLQARPLDPVDFEARGGLPLHGWPFSRGDLDPYYRRAQTICNLGPYAYEVEAWENGGRGQQLPLDRSVVASEVIQFGRQSSFDRFEKELSAASNIDVVVHATAVELVSKTGDVEHVACATLEGNHFKVRAGTVILAAGGIENARLLLVSKGAHARGLGNEHDLVGRYFMEHLDVEAGFLLPSDTFDTKLQALYLRQNGGETYDFQAMLRLSDDVIAREGLLNSVMRIRPTYPSAMRPALRSARAIRRAVHFGVPIPGLLGHAARIAAGARDMVDHQLNKRRGRSADILRVDVMAEQAPNPESRVKLGRKKDRLGMPVTELDWRCTEQDLYSLRRTLQIFAEAFRQSGLGTLETMLNPGAPAPAVFGNWHHLGTTRMHRDPAKGVVDEHCQVHGVPNLFLAGSSVFPTGGYANPTLTIVALALRLADRLKSGTYAPSAAP
jgi:choline dehydrogenase-like flavoprotein